MRTRLQRFCFVSVAGLCVTGLMSWSAAMAKDELRTWADASGKNKIKAKFVKLEDDTVTLENEDGEEIEIELKKLSAADQKVAVQASKDASDNPFKSKGKTEDPFKPKSKSKKPAQEMDADDDAGDSARTVSVDLSSADHISLAATNEEWSLELPAEETPKPATRSKPISIPSKADFFDGLKAMVFSRGSPKTIAVGFLFEKPGGSEAVSRIALCDLSTGKCGAPAASSGKMLPIAVHDDGRQVVMRSEEFGFGKHDRLEVWIPKGKKVSKTVSWIPYNTENGAARDVTWAEFISPSQLATANSGGRVVIWKFPKIEPICYFDTENGAVPALSPDRKWIAFTASSIVGVFDVEKQEVIAQEATPQKLNSPNLVFSPSGKKLGCVAFDKVLVWDVATGELEREIPCTGLHVNGNIEFPDENFVLVGNQFLIDLENQLKLWTYERAEQVHVSDGVTYFALTDGDKKPGVILPMQIPHPAARDLLKKALSDPNLFVLKAGTSVRIDINGIPDPAQKERVAKALSKRLESIGCKGGTTGTIDVVASVEGPKDTKLRFRGSGEYNFKEYISRVKFVYQGQTAWESVTSNGPGFMVVLAAGENMESHLRAREKPSYEFFDKVQLPKFLQKPTGDKGAGNSLTIGKSQVTTAGLK